MLLGPCLGNLTTNMTITMTATMIVKITMTMITTMMLRETVRIYVNMLNTNIYQICFIFKMFCRTQCKKNLREQDKLNTICTLRLQEYMMGHVF